MSLIEQAAHTCSLHRTHWKGLVVEKERLQRKQVSGRAGGGGSEARSSLIKLRSESEGYLPISSSDEELDELELDFLTVAVGGATGCSGGTSLEELDSVLLASGA